MNAGQLADLIDGHAAALVLFARQWSTAPEDVVQDSFCKLVSQSVPPHDPVACRVRQEGEGVGRADAGAAH